MEEIESYTHGGKRQKAGRKTKPDKKVPYCTKVRPDQREWLRMRNGSKEIEVLIDGAMLREKE